MPTNSDTTCPEPQAPGFTRTRHMAKKGAKKQNNVILYQHPGGRVGDPIVYGNVKTDIYANLRPWGEVVYKIRQQRILPHGYDKEYGEWFAYDEIADIMRGAYAAQRRIAKRRRRLMWRGIFWW